jgi:hypothetical protein
MPAKKDFEKYLIESTYSHVLHENYVESPASAFLRYSLDAKDSINLCKRYFPKKQDGGFTKDSQSSLEHLCSAMLPAVMRHFETFQRHLFAGVFEYSAYLNGFDTASFFKKIEKDLPFTINPVRLAAYRGFNAPVGIVLADSMPGWHSPQKVNQYFKFFGFNQQFFSNADCSQLCVLWQLRHSIVHSGGTLTIPDAQKVKELAEWGGYPVVFDDKFVFEVSRKLHPLVQNSVGRAETDFRAKMKANVGPDVSKAIDKLFEVKSKCAVWLN